MYIFPMQRSPSPYPLPTEERGKRIIILGSSSGMPSPSRFCSSFLLETEKGKYLFDAGEGVSFSLLRNKIDFNQINYIFITHSHVDHLGGLFLLIQMMHLSQRKTPLNIYLPQEAVSGVENFLQTLYLFKEKLSLRLNLFPIKPNFVFKNEEINLNAHLNRHLFANEQVIREYNLPNRMQSFCFVVNLSAVSTGNEKKLVYSGDIGSSGDLTNIAFDADLLITECMHPRLEDLLSLITESKVKSAIFTHIPVELEGKEKIILEKAQEFNFHNLRIAHDGLVVEI
jgi:ribonuclease BN (tRNA processing enzyme)